MCLYFKIDQMITEIPWVFSSLALLTFRVGHVFEAFRAKVEPNPIFSCAASLASRGASGTKFKHHGTPGVNHLIDYNGDLAAAVRHPVKMGGTLNSRT